jgi:hypothetical protein
MSEIRYLKIILVDGARFILRVTRESPHFIVGIEVDAEGDEIVPRGVDAEGRPWHQRERKVQRGTIRRAVEMRMNPKYATLEVAPRGEQKAHATKRQRSTPKGPFEVGDLVAASYRVPPFMGDDVLVVKELQNLGTRTKPHWRARVASLSRRDVRRDPRGEPVEGWLDAEILERPPGWGKA